MRWENEEIEMRPVVQNAKTIQAMICPKCHKGLLLQGPRGGLAVNVKCERCGEWYWYGVPLGLGTMDDV